MLKPKLLANCCVNSYPLPLKPCIAPTAPPNKRVNILASACLNLSSNLIKLSIQPATLKPKDIGTAFCPIVLPSIGISEYLILKSDSFFMEILKFLRIFL